MKSIFLILIFVYLFPIVSHAQPMGMRPWKRDPFCGRAFELHLTPEQTKALELLQQVYLRETQLLRTQLFTKRLEIRELLTHPDNKTELIRTKHMELAELQSKIEEKRLEYLLKVRQLLTPDQLRFWCPEQEFPMVERMMPKHPSMGWPKGPKKNLLPEE